MTVDTVHKTLRVYDCGHKALWKHYKSLWMSLQCTIDVVFMEKITEENTGIDEKRNKTKQNMKSKHDTE